MTPPPTPTLALAGVYIDASYSALAEEHDSAMGGGWVGGESGIKIASASESRQGGSTRKWGDRPAVFLPDLTALIPSGTYGWWPFAIRVPRGSSVAVAALAATSAAPAR